MDDKTIKHAFLDLVVRRRQLSTEYTTHLLLCVEEGGGLDEEGWFTTLDNLKNEMRDIENLIYAILFYLKD